MEQSATQQISGCWVTQSLHPTYNFFAQILPIGILAALVYQRNGNLNIKYALIIAVGLIVGNFFGALFANQPFISSELMKKLYGIFVLMSGIRYLLSN